MVFEAIRQFLGSQNFALTATNTQEICVLRNQADSRGIFCVLLDNTRYTSWSASQIASINSQLQKTTAGGTLDGINDVLFIVVTNNIIRDRYMESLSGIRLWLADTNTAQLIIYEDQPSDFYGLRGGIEAAMIPRDPYHDPFDHGYINDGKQAQYSDTSDRASRNYGSNHTGNIKRTAFSRNVPFVTIALIAVNVIWYLVLAFGGNTTNSLYMLEAGASYSPLIFEQHQYWRLFTCMFMHFGISHLMSNMFYLAVLGYSVEKNIGHIRFLVFYMVCGLGSSIVSACYYYWTNTNTVSAGASGAIYGIIGVLGVLMVRTLRRGGMQRPAYIFLRFAIALIFIFYSSFIQSDVDGAAHIGGFIIGILLSVIFLRKKT